MFTPSRRESATQISEAPCVVPPMVFHADQRDLMRCQADVTPRRVASFPS